MVMSRLGYYRYRRLNCTTNADKLYEEARRRVTEQGEHWRLVAIEPCMTMLETAVALRPARRR